MFKFLAIYLGVGFIGAVAAQIFNKELREDPELTLPIRAMAVTWTTPVVPIAAAVGFVLGGVEAVQDRRAA